MTHPLGPDTYIDDPDDADDSGNDERENAFDSVMVGAGVAATLTYSHPSMPRRGSLAMMLDDIPVSDAGWLGPGPANLRYGRGHIPPSNHYPGNGGGNGGDDQYADDPAND